MRLRSAPGGTPGDQRHSAAHPGPDPRRGKTAVIVGADTFAHAIAAALRADDMDVALLQRSSTRIAKPGRLMDVGLRAPCSQETVRSGPTTQPADVIVAATGCGSMNGGAADPIGQEVADKGGTMRGPGAGTARASGPRGRRAAQHVDAPAAAGAMGPGRQPAPVAR